MKILKTLLLSIYFFLTSTAYAANDIGLDPDNQPGGIIVGKKNVGNPDNLFGSVFKNTIVIFFTIGGVGFTIMFLWGAVDWILSGGDKEKIAHARKRIVTAITGLVLLSLTFAVMVVLGQILGIGPLSTFNFPIPRLSDK